MATEAIARGRVEATLLTPFGQDLSVEVPKLEVIVGEGVRGDRHAGQKLSDARETVLKKIGAGAEIPIANVRQWSAVSVEEMEAISERMGTPKPIPPGLCGENLRISGIEDFTLIPPTSLLTFSEGEWVTEPVFRKAVLGVWALNAPCHIPNRNIIEYFHREGEPFEPTKPFASAAHNLRGLVGFVYCSGKIKPGDVVHVWASKGAS